MKLKSVFAAPFRLVHCFIGFSDGDFDIKCIHAAQRYADACSNTVAGRL